MVARTHENATKAVWEGMEGMEGIVRGIVYGPRCHGIVPIVHSMYGRPYIQGFLWEGRNGGVKSWT